MGTLFLMETQIACRLVRCESIKERCNPYPVILVCIRHDSPYNERSGPRTRQPQLGATWVVIGPQMALKALLIFIRQIERFC